jgi:hypothetical protein
MAFLLQLLYGCVCQMLGVGVVVPLPSLGFVCASSGVPTFSAAKLVVSFDTAKHNFRKNMLFGHGFFI